MLARLPFELAQADNYLIYDDFLHVSPPRQQFWYIAPSKSAGTSLSTTAFAAVDRAIRITDINILPDGSSSGIDASDTSVWTIKNGSTTIVSTTFNAASGAGSFPATHTLTSLGTLANQVVGTGGYLTIAITNTTNAATPATIVQVGYQDLSAVSNWAVDLPNGGNAVVNDGLAGILTLTPSGSSPAQSDEAYIYSPQQVFQPSAGYPLYLEALIQYTEANVNQAGIFFGLASGVSAGGLITSASAGIRSTGTVVGIYKVAGSTVWSVISQNGSNATTNTSTCTAGGSTYQKLNVEVLDVIAGNATVVFRVDGQLLRDTNNPTLPIKQNLILTSDSICSLVAGVKNGSSSMETLNIDYMAAVQSRVSGADG
jgi:hypothetical protein